MSSTKLEDYSALREAASELETPVSDTESSDDSNGIFAFGSGSVAEIGCPAVKAGFETMATNPSKLYPARHKFLGEYDTILRNISGRDEGLVSEQIAADAWSLAITRVKQHDKDKKEDMLSFAYSVKDELNWEKII
jgi:hypothetical protein